MQASSLSTAAAESAQHKLRALDSFKAPLGAAALGKAEEPDMPAPAELAMFGVTHELLDFVRSLTYSTFRDFPTETLAPPVQVCSMPSPSLHHVESLSCTRNARSLREPLKAALKQCAVTLPGRRQPFYHHACSCAACAITF